MSKNSLTGTVLGVYLGLSAESLITTPQPSVNATFAGFEGDKHAGITRKSDSRTPRYPRGTEIRNDRQISIVSVEELDAIAQEMGIACLNAEWLGANLLVAGIPNLTQLPAMARMYFSGGVTLVLSGENRPCMVAGRAVQSQADSQGENPQMAEAFIKAARGRRGLVASVELPGVIAPGETISLE